MSSEQKVAVITDASQGIGAAWPDADLGAGRGAGLSRKWAEQIALANRMGSVGWSLRSSSLRMVPLHVSSRAKPKCLSDFYSLRADVALLFPEGAS